MLSKEYKEVLLEVLRNVPPKKADWKGCSQIWKGLRCLGFGIFVTLLRVVIVCLLPISAPILAYLTILDNRDRERQIKEWKGSYNNPLRRKVK